MAGQLENKAALVTGGSSGIGRASALALAREGAKVVVADVNVEDGEATVEMIKEAGGEAISIKADVSQAAEVQAMVSRAVESYGRLDCAVNNAGIAGAFGTPAADYSEDAWHEVISVNLTGVWLCMKYEIRQMLQQDGGAIVNVASVMGLVGTANAGYTASKHGVVGLTKSAALSYSKEGININAVCPGFIDTPLTESAIASGSQVEAHLNSSHPIGRIGKPTEIAESVVWLCSDAASFVTGHTMVIDGGYVAQ